jgi:hypothetical protein
MKSFFRHLHDETEDFPEWKPDDIEGWEDMSKDEQGELKEFYDSMKDLFEALSKMEDIELEALDKDAPKEEEKEEKKEEKRQLYNYMPPTVRRVL